MKIEDILEKIKDFISDDIIYITTRLPGKLKLGGSKVTDVVITREKPRLFYKIKIKNKDQFLNSVEAFLKQTIKFLKTFFKWSPLKTRREPALKVDQSRTELHIYYKAGGMRLTILELRRVRRGYTRVKNKKLSKKT